jgi:hypothetical protein
LWKAKAVENIPLFVKRSAMLVLKEMKNIDLPIKTGRIDGSVPE